MGAQAAFTDDFETRADDAGSGIDYGSLTSQLAQAFEDFKSKHDRELAEVKAGIKAAPADLSKVEDALTKLQTAKDAIDAKAAAQQKRIDDLEKRLNRPGAGGASNDNAAEVKAFNLAVKSMAAQFGRQAPAELSDEDYVNYKAAFRSFLRSGQSWNDAERKALIVGSDPDGGILVPADTTGRIIERIYETSPVRQYASTQAISTDALEGIIDNDEAGAVVWVTEQDAPAETATPKLGKWRIPVWEGYVEPRATQQLLEDASVDIEAWLARKVADKIARGTNSVFVTGNGVGKARGFTDYTTAATADGSRAWGTLEHVATGVNGDFAASAPADKLFDLIGAFKDAHLARARWVTRREVITKVRKFKGATTGDYLWQPGLQAGQPQQLCGFPVTIDQDIPTLATGSKSMWFGDFAEAVQIVDRLGMRTLRDNLTSKPFVKFYTRFRTGAGVIQFDAIKCIQFS